MSIGLIQGIFIITSLQTLFPRGSKKSWPYKCLKGAQTIPVLLILASAIWFFFVVFLPVEVSKPYSSFKGFLHILTACYLWLNVAFNYLAAMTVSPAYPETRQELEEDTEIELEVLNFCTKCTRVRDKGTHHCSSCNSCVMMMSHHCPFTNNCVGLDNFAYFYLFLLYCSIGLVFALYCSYASFVACMMNSLTTPYDFTDNTLYKRGMCSELGDYAAMFLVVAFMLVFILTMFFFHTFLLIADMSVIDLLKACQKLTYKDLLKSIFIARCLGRKKVLFRKMLYYRRENWWKFFLPSFNELPELLPPDDFLV